VRWGHRREPDRLHNGGLRLCAAQIRGQELLVRNDVDHAHAARACHDRAALYLVQHLRLGGFVPPIIVPKFLATDAFFVFLLVQFIRSLPKELDEAAIIDGCSKVGVFLRIIVPLATPALVTTALFTFLWTWDDFFNHLLYLTNPPDFHGIEGAAHVRR
jgi:hypothetical protein